MHEKPDKRISFKVIILLVMFFECFLGLTPHFFGKCCKQNPYPLSFLNCYAAGTFFTMSLMHVLPETVEQYGTYMSVCHGNKEPYPLPYLMYVLGYVVILSVDRWFAPYFTN